MADDFEREVIDRLARIETKLEGMADLESRIDKLEDESEQRKGIRAFITALVGMASGVLGVLGGKLL